MARELRNYMEICLDEMIDRVLDEIGGCRCGDCVTDIKALALNNLAPKYIATDKGHLYSKVDSICQQFEVDIVRAVTYGAKIVAERPRHDESPEPS
jgi:competence protein ComFB